jgi:arsenate reductase
MAEAILTHLGSDKCIARSAGSHPAGFVHPLAVTALEHIDVPLHPNALSKSWDAFKNVPFGVLITLCAAADGLCPTWLTANLRCHWPLSDPTFHVGTIEERVEFAVRIAERLRLKIERFLNLDLHTGDKAALKTQLDLIAEL